MRGRVKPLPKGYIEHQGIQYAHFESVESDTETEHYPEQVIAPLLGWPTDDLIFMEEHVEIVGSTVTLINVRWRSDQGWTAPHDVAIIGPYIVHMPQEDR